MLRKSTFIRTLKAMAFSTLIFSNTVYAYTAPVKKTKPWYSIKKIDELQIFVNFPKYSMTINPVYLFHLRFMVEHLKIDQTLHHYIYKKENRFSKIRAKKIRDYLVNRLGAPEDRVHILDEEDQLEYDETLDEKIRILLTRAIYFKSSEPSKPQIVEVDLTAAESRPKKSGENSFELGVSSRLSNYIEEFDDEGVGVFFKLTFNTQKVLRFHIEGESVLFKEAKTDPEMRFAIGIESNYNLIESHTQVYYRKNLAKNITTNLFESYQDIGISQKLWFKLIKRKSFTHRVGLLGDFSFSNNSEKLRNSNILAYGFETGIELRSGYKINVFYEKRKIRNINGFKNESEHVGLGLSYIF